MNFKPYIKALKKKDQAAFEAIYHETKHAVFAMVLPIVRDRSLAEDVMQDTYIKMMEKINSYNSKYNFYSWLLTIAKNTALDLLRQRRESPIDQSENEDLFISPTSSIEKKLESEYYLSLLTDEEKQIVLLKIVGDLKHKAIADLIDKPEGTVRYMYKNALDKMRKNAEGGSA